MSIRRFSLSFLALWIAVAFTAVFAGEAGQVDSPETLILGTYSFWRCHLTLRPPLYGTAHDAQPDADEILRVGKRMGKLPKLPLTQPHSPLPPSGWMKLEFDDRGWWRQPGPFPGYQAGIHGPRKDLSGGSQCLGIALVCARGKFTVTDPSQVHDLTFSAAFRGGIVVYVNGKEVLRKYMPPGKISLETLAEDYPAQVSLLPGKKELRTPQGKMKFEQLVSLRLRRVSHIPIPPNLLRKGTNVLAIEVHRTAILQEGEYNWNRCALVDVAVRSASKRGILANMARPRSFQVWNANLLDDVTDVDYGDVHEELLPIRIVGTRNGTFSGKVVVSSNEVIKELTAEISDLVQEAGKGKIPKALIQVRYPLLDAGVTHIHSRFPPERYGTERGDEIVVKYREVGLSRFNTLKDAPSPEVKVRDKSGVPSNYPHRFGAVQPIWVAVRIPRDAPPGRYQGVLKVTAQGQDEVNVPIHLTVCPWVLPDGKNYNTFVDFVQSPESIALHYGVPLWSDEHFELMGKTFKLIGEVGNTSLYIPVITPTHFGNSQTMVRWVKEPDGTYTYDFSLLDKYLDLAKDYMGKPKVVCFYVWEYYLGGDAAAGAAFVVAAGANRLDRMVTFEGETVTVSQLDPATGRLELLQLPAYGKPGSREVWKPFANALHAFMKRRGLEEAMMLGLAGDIRPTREQVLFWKEILPQARWVVQGHGRADQLHGVPVGYCSSIFGCKYAFLDPDIQRFHGWQRPDITTLFPRRLGLHFSSTLFFRLVPEWNVGGGQNGIGRIDADFFDVTPPGERGQRKAYRLISKDPKCSWRNASLVTPWLAAGPHGAISTVNFELFREGVQECEARISIDQALTDEVQKAKLGHVLAARCQDLLDERTRTMMWVFNEDYLNYNRGGSMLSKGPVDLSWFAGSGWQQRSAKLYNAAAEVAEALGGNGASGLAAQR